MDEGGGVHALVELPQTWTYHELHKALAAHEQHDPPRDVDWRCYEIIDGALVVSPSADSWHEFASAVVRAVIAAALPAELRVIGPMGVAIGRSYLLPDLLVTRLDAFAARRGVFSPADVLLAVEIVSPSSVAMDRIMKPAKYAAAGIGAYWRVETDPAPSLTAHTLRPGAESYTEIGTWAAGQVVELSEPFPVRFPTDDLVPRG